MKPSESSKKVEESYLSSSYQSKGGRQGMGWGIRPEQSRCGDVVPAEETACTKTQQDRARGPGEALWQVSTAGVEEPWGRQEGRAEPD